MPYTYCTRDCWGHEFTYLISDADRHGSHHHSLWIKGFGGIWGSGLEDEPNDWRRLEHRVHLVVIGGTTARWGISLYGTQESILIAFTYGVIFSVAANSDQSKLVAYDGLCLIEINYIKNRGAECTHTHGPLPSHTHINNILEKDVKMPGEIGGMCVRRSWLNAMHTMHH